MEAPVSYVVCWIGSCMTCFVHSQKRPRLVGSCQEVECRAKALCPAEVSINSQRRAFT